MGGQHHAPAALPSGKTRYLLYRRLGVSSDLSGWARKTSSTLEFDPQAVHLVVSRYTAYTILSAIMGRYLLESCPLHWLSSRRFFIVLPQYRRQCRYITFYAAKVQVRPAPIVRTGDSIRVIWAIDKVVK